MAAALTGLAGGGAVAGGAAGGAGAMPPLPTLDSANLPDWIPLPAWLTGNPYFTAGAGLVGMGAAMSVLRSSSASLEVVFRRQLLMSLEIPSKDYSYQWVMQWLVARGVHGSKHLGVETTYTKDSAGRQLASFDFVPSPGRHWMYYRGTPFLVERQREARTVDHSTGSPWETLTLTTVAWRPTLFQDLLMEAKESALAREEGMTVIYQQYGHEWRPFGSPKRIRPFDSVILDGNASDEILRDVSEFMSSQQWYLDRGIPYRRGYLLHGPPGCGKSSFVAALAGQLGYNICILNLGDPGMTDDRLQHLLAVVPPRSCVLLEDIDFAVGESQPADKTGPYAGVMRVSFSGLLNALDGVVATEERIVFMTTNHFKRLPRALVRPGRVDLNIYVGLASKLQLHRMFTRFFPGQDALAEQFAVLCEGEGLSMAELQGFFMFFKDQPDAAAANAGPWVEARREIHSGTAENPLAGNPQQAQQAQQASQQAAQAPEPATSEQQQQQEQKEQKQAPEEAASTSSKTEGSGGATSSS